ncbi:MAG: (deoxy)nucleoside triphosphate pyrophosphohydrolase [Alphaproteobacteria bacterium]|nr:(deoxy)nucleoside triphosphate pyrophosphohydrolase [Alphaproteobacteria bacterium]
MSKPHIRVVAAEIERDGAFLITQRRPEATMPLLWEFPGGKVEPGETDEQALARELREEMDIGVSVIERSLHVSHEYDDYTLDLVVYRATTIDTPKLLRVHDYRWVRPEHFDRYQFPGADQRTIDALLAD